MENIHGFSTFKKPVISEHIWHGMPQHAFADNIYLTNLQKRENRQNGPPS